MSLSVGAIPIPFKKGSQMGSISGALSVFARFYGNDKSLDRGGQEEGPLNKSVLSVCSRSATSTKERTSDIKLQVVKAPHAILDPHGVCKVEEGKGAWLLSPIWLYTRWLQRNIEYIIIDKLASPLHPNPNHPWIPLQPLGKLVETTNYACHKSVHQASCRDIKAFKFNSIFPLVSRALAISIIYINCNG